MKEHTEFDKTYKKYVCDNPCSNITKYNAPYRLCVACSKGKYNKHKKESLFERLGYVKNESLMEQNNAFSWEKENEENFNIKSITFYLDSETIIVSEIIDGERAIPELTINEIQAINEQWKEIKANDER